MPDALKTTTTTRLPLTGATAGRLLTPSRVGMPALDSIQKTIDFAPKAGGRIDHIMRTTETDAYERTPAAVKLTKLLRAKGAPPSAVLAAAVKAQPPKGNIFVGSDRKAAKLSKAPASTENIKDLKDLIASFMPESKMIKHKPPILLRRRPVGSRRKNVMWASRRFCMRPAAKPIMTST